MSWFEQLTTEPQDVIPPRQQAKPPLPGGKWFDQITNTGPAIGPSKGVPQFVEEVPERMAGALTQAGASLPTGQEDKAKFYAKQRGIPIDSYFYKDDRLAYIDPTSGKAYFEEPKLRAPTSMSNISQYPKALASGAGPAMPMVGGVAGGIAAMGEGPIGWGTAVPQAAAGGAIGDMARQFLANKVAGEEKPFGERAMQTGGAAIQEGVGQIFGNAGGKALSVFGRTPTYNIPTTTRLQTSAEKWKIPLTAGEETGNRTLLRRQKILGNTTEGEQRFSDFYNGRNEAVGEAVNTLLSKVSPQASPRMGAQSGVEGAQAGRRAVQQEVQDIARPFYKAAIDDNPQRFWTPDVEELFTRPSMQEAISAAKKLAAEEGRNITVPTFEKGQRVKDELVPDWTSWDYMKKALDGVIEANTNDAGRVTQYGRSVVATKKRLLEILDGANPAYKQARGTFAKEVPLRDAVENGVVGDIAKLEGNDTLRASGIIFGKGSSPEDVKMARAAFEKAGAGQNWDDLLRAHLQQVFNEIPDSSVGSITNLGGSYRKAILGNKRKREMLEAAFEHRPELWNETLDLMQVLDATGRAMKGESITAFAQAGQKELAREGSGLGPSLIETLEVWRTPSRVAQYWADLNTSKYAARQAELLTTPEGRQVLREIKKLGPTSAGSVLALSHFLTAGGIGAVSGLLNQKPDGPVVSTGNTSKGPQR